MTRFVEVSGGRIAYDVRGEGPLVILSPGMGNQRQAFRHLAPLLAEAGFRVANVDMRGHGESSMGWASITRTDVAEDLLAVIRELGGPAMIVGHSLSGGSATIAAAMEPELVSAIVELNPFTRKQSIDLGGLFTNQRYRKGLLRLAGTQIFKSLKMWLRYLDHAHVTRPADHDQAMEALAANLREPGRMAEFMKTTKSTPADAHARLGDVKSPALIVMGLDDPDFADPKAEGDAVVALMPAGIGTVATLPGAGHYPHAEVPAELAALIVPFLKEHAVA
ncbi:alpha/beta hydrolase [Actinocorallia longicatena]|uniref:Alpha/beta hydrolase n=1 Tax=Actinocorallia longicatena TaxID=111803 RepID=A0ABP6QLT0_9ACTN